MKREKKNAEYNERTQSPIYECKSEYYDIFIEITQKEWEKERKIYWDWSILMTDSNITFIKHLKESQWNEDMKWETDSERIRK